MPDEIDSQRQIITKSNDEKFNQRLGDLRFSPNCDECNDADGDLYERWHCNNGYIDSFQSWSVILEIKAKKSILEDTHRRCEFLWK